ncbi:MAG: DUF1552 domain-containing protein [Rhodospirillaceae bacterium]|nr:DUF1552 domain-containing protein [Rhodospirillaceae bacterium]
MLQRRRVLRGMLNGGAVTVALPLLNCFLNGNGNALADGKPMPIRFGTYYWALGMTKAIFVPKKTGAGYEITEEMEALRGVQKHFNVLTNFTAFRDNAENLCHHTGWVISRTGIAPMLQQEVPGETLDVTIANQISRTTRFKLLNASAGGDARGTFSYETPTTPNAPEVSPMQFYTRLFGPDFQDPNAKTFTPNPTVMARKSVLSGVLDEIKDLNAKVGAEDKARIDQYFSGLRHLEKQFDQQLTKPEPIAACIAPKPFKEDAKVGNESTVVAARHDMLTQLMVMAIACDQTRVFNMSYNGRGSNTTKLGYEKPHHTTTHEEPVDPQLGYQPNCSWFTRRCMESLASYIKAFADQKEGDGSLLDNVFIMANSDHGYARIHSLDGMAMFSFGKAGGKVKSGLHIDGGGTAVTRLGYSAMRIMGLDTPQWGTKSNTTSKEIGEILA